HPSPSENAGPADQHRGWGTSRRVHCRRRRDAGPVTRLLVGPSTPGCRALLGRLLVTYAGPVRAVSPAAHHILAARGRTRGELASRGRARALRSSARAPARLLGALSSTALRGHALSDAHTW